MLSHFPPRLDAGFSKPDIDICSHAERLPRVSRSERFRRVALVVAGAAFAVFLVAVLLFVPILIGELSRVDRIVSDAGAESAAEFVQRLKSLFYGAVIVSSAIISFIMSFLLAPFEPRFHTLSDYRLGHESRLAARRSEWHRLTNSRSLRSDAFGR